ncbi:MAG: GTP pyrophosphokinase [Lachnospiraceae bacterium]|nr:GTP pyrophosphokinase [Lachnospiraceae bacterium]MBR4058490.1 GTP pyrophosphokinase [Lachnospiraceae bacterium]
MSVLLERAKAIVEREFGKRYEEGECYKLHTYRVMEAMDTEEEQIVALLHDIIEDTEVSMVDLEGEGFSKAVLDALEDLTKGNQVRYFDYIEDLSLNPLAAKVKLAELKDNMDVVRVNRMSFRTYSLEDRCEKAMDILTEALKDKV